MNEPGIRYEDFLELASLAVLDDLGDRDRLFVEEYAATSSELESELVSLRIAAAAIPYSLEPVGLPKHLKDRLFQSINSEHPIEKPIEKTLEKFSDRFQAEQLSFTLRSQDLVWQPHPSVPGLTVAQLHTDPIKRQFSALVRCEPGITYPHHQHAEDEEIFMVEGDLVMDSEVYVAGDYIYSAHSSIHAPSSTNGCVFFVRSSIDDRFV
jgi:hypothetical protein